MIKFIHQNKDDYLKSGIAPYLLVQRYQQQDCGFCETVIIQPDLLLSLREACYLVCQAMKNEHE